MAASEDPEPKWETQAEVDACLAETGVTPDQLNRWRREGLLPPIVQEPKAYRGSSIYYPAGTCAQIRAVQALLGEKFRIKYAGLQLWRRGFWVREDHWRPRLSSIAAWADRVLPVISRLSARADRDEAAPMLPEIVAQYPVKNIILSRIRKRLKDDDLAIFYRVATEISLGEFSGFEVPSGDERRARVETAAIKGFDLEDSEKREILGTNINLIEALHSTLEAIAAAIAGGGFAEAANAPAEEIAQARDDARRALQIAICLYEPLKWIYGEGAFGLRLAAWFAQKATDPMIDGLILAMLRLRKIPGATLPSEKIAEMARQSHQFWRDWKRIQWLSENDPRFSAVLKPRRIRSAFVDEITLKRWREEVQRASMRELEEIPKRSRR